MFLGILVTYLDIFDWSAIMRLTIDPREGGFLLPIMLITKYILLGLGLSSSLYPAVGVNSTSPVLAQDPLAAQINLAEAREVVNLWVTAYSSTPEETDDTPFITASGKSVRDGIVATNLLPFGTRIQIPKIFGDRVFVVEDRMHQRKTNHLDIWMSSQENAKKFGIAYTQVLVLN